MTGVVSFYLASPFSFLIAFFDKQSVTEGILLITILKTAACGLTFSIYTRKALHLCAAPNLCFSIAYSLMSYVIVYALNIMWLDGVIFLPLVLLGLHRLQDKGSMLLLTMLIRCFLSLNFTSLIWLGFFLCCILPASVWLKRGFPENHRKIFCQRSVGCGPQRLFMAAHLRTACLCIPSGTPELFYRRCDFFKNFQQDFVWQL